MFFFKVLCLLAVTPVAVYADWDAESKIFLIAQNLDLDAAAKQIQTTINGRILEAKVIRIDNKQYYRFKVLTEKEGRIRYIKVDPVTGQLTGK